MRATASATIAAVASPPRTQSRPRSSKAPAHLCPSTFLPFFCHSAAQRRNLLYAGFRLGLVIARKVLLRLIILGCSYRHQSRSPTKSPALQRAPNPPNAIANLPAASKKRQE